MKFCVFGVNKYKDFYNISARKNLSINPFDFYESLHSYEFQVSSKKFCRVFFLVDFGYELEWAYFFKGITYDEYNFATLPWMMLASYNVINPDEFMLTPLKITLKLKGFKEEFENPIEAMKRYEYFIKNKLKCDMYVDIDAKHDIFATSSSADIAKNKLFGPNIYCRKYKIKG